MQIMSSVREAIIGWSNSRSDTNLTGRLTSPLLLHNIHKANQHNSVRMCTVQR